MSDAFTVEVRVSLILKEFYHSIYGSDIIPVSKGDLLSTKIKYLLDHPQEDYTPVRETSSVLNFQLLDFHIGNRRLFKHSSNYLDARSQRILCNELNKEMKHVFHNYVLGYVRALSACDGSQKKAILDFCDVYNLSMTAINYEMLKKSWDRSEQKKLI